MAELTRQAWGMTAELAMKTSVNLEGELFKSGMQRERVACEIQNAWMETEAGEKQSVWETVQAISSGNREAIDWSSRDVGSPSKKRKFAHGGGQPSRMQRIGAAVATKETVETLQGTGSVTGRPAGSSKPTLRREDFK